jgi:HK97 family phage major capsid protein
VSSASLAEIREDIAAKNKFIFDVLEQAGPDTDLDKVTLLEGDTYYKAGEIRRLQKEVDDLARKRDEIADIEQIAKRAQAEHARNTEPASGMMFPGATGGGFSASRKAGPGLRELIGNSKAYRDLKAGTVRQASFEIPVLDFKTLVTLATISPQVDRRDMVPMAMEERTVADLMLQGETDRPSIEYYEETTFTNTAAEVNEGDAKAEGTIGFTLRTENVRKIAWWIPFTDEALADNAFLESEIRGRLAFGVRRREEQQLLSGNGSAPNIRGILNRTGIQTQAVVGPYTAMDAVYQAMQKVRGASGAGFAEPTGIVMHPNDFTDIKLSKTADGIYLYGSPAEEGPDRLWSLPIRQTTAIAENTALVGAFRPYSMVVRRTGITITLSTEHSTYFVENKVAVLAEERLAVQVTRPSAFCTVTSV